jgi:hypothetical protein
LPQRGTGWPFELEGRLHLPAERLDINTHSPAPDAPRADGAPTAPPAACSTAGRPCRSGPPPRSP